MEVKEKLLRLNNTLHEAGLDSRLHREAVGQLFIYFDSLATDYASEVEADHYVNQNRHRRTVQKQSMSTSSTNTGYMKTVPGYVDEATTVIESFDKGVESIRKFKTSKSFVDKASVVCEVVSNFGPVLNLIPVAGPVLSSFAGLGSAVLGIFNKKEKKPLAGVLTDAVEDAKNAVIEKIDEQTQRLEDFITKKIDGQTEFILGAIEDGRRADNLAKYEGEITMMMERQVLLTGLITMDRNLTRFELDMLSGEQWYFAGAGFLGALKSLIEEDLRTVDQITARRVARYLISFIKLSIAQRSMRLMFSGLMLFHGQPTNSDLQEHRDEQALQLLNQLTERDENSYWSSNFVYLQFDQPELGLIEQYYESLGGLQLSCRLPQHASTVQTLQEDYNVARLLNPQKMVALKYVWYFPLKHKLDLKILN